jgi:hypothetical protein
LVQDAVEGGASIGFVLPLKRRELEAYWQSVVAAMRDGERHLLAAFDDGQLIGAVQLALEPRPNGRHRAEIMKLMVQRTHRRAWRGAPADGRRHRAGRQGGTHVAAARRAYGRSRGSPVPLARLRALRRGAALRPRARRWPGRQQLLLS